MQRLVVAQSGRKEYTSNAGLALLGQCVRLANLETLVDTVAHGRGVTHGDVVKTYLGQSALGKSDFEAVENLRQDGFFREALGIGQVLSSARVRQRLDEGAKDLIPEVDRALVHFLTTAQVPVPPPGDRPCAPGQRCLSPGQLGHPEGGGGSHTHGVMRIALVPPLAAPWTQRPGTDRRPPSFIG